jgi:hypothetical protein
MFPKRRVIDLPPQKKVGFVGKVQLIHFVVQLQKIAGGPGIGKEAQIDIGARAMRAKCA